jgi:hypothetical protein
LEVNFKTAGLHGKRRFGIALAAVLFFALRAWRDRRER